MKIRFLAGIVLAVGISFTAVAQAFLGSPERAARPGGPALAADHGDCAQLTQLKLPDVKVTEAVAVPAGTGAIKVAHCRVAGVIGAEIKFSLLLPTPGTGSS
jgi:hypothetical protein